VVGKARRETVGERNAPGEAYGYPRRQSGDVGEAPPPAPTSPPGRGTRRGRSVTADPPLVSVVDDDESIRESLPDLLCELGFAAEAFASAEEFLASGRLDDTRCLVLDVSMPGMTGPELQEELARRGDATPIVFITAQQDEYVRPRLLAAGAVACLYKPFSDTALLDAVRAAVGVGR
jgi:CheY-like chemotaxis protein